MNKKEIKYCTCGVPNHLHATCCGWDNVALMHNGTPLQGVEIEKIWNQLKPK